MKKTIKWLMIYGIIFMIVLIIDQTIHWLRHPGEDMSKMSIVGLAVIIALLILLINVIQLIISKRKQ